MPKTCLIGEADPFIARLLRRYAEESGLSALNATTGQELLALARRHRPVVIVTEVELPGEIRGWEAIQACRIDDLLKSTPVILCSWLPVSQALELSGQVSGFLQKPDVHFEEFQAALLSAKVRDRGRSVPPAPKTRGENGSGS